MQQSVYKVHAALAGQPDPKRLPRTTRKSVPPQNTRTNLPQVMSTPQPHGMNRSKTNHARHNQPERRPGCPHIPAGGGPTARAPKRPTDPATHTTSQAIAAARHQPRQASEGPNQGQCTHVKAKTPSDEGECCARGGTRTAFQPLQTLGSRGNMRNPARSDPGTTQSEAQSVYFVHTPFLTNFEQFHATAARP